MKKKKKIIFFLLLLFILIVCMYIFRNNIKDIFIPIYKVEDRINNIKKESKKTNGEVQGWIKVQGTNIDYPIVLEKDTEEDASYSYSWINYSLDLKNDNYTPIFGHNIRNVSSQPLINDDSLYRFEQLMSFIYYDFAKENKYVQVTYNNKNYLYQIFSVSLIDENDVIYYSKNYSSKEFKKYIKKSLDRSYFKYNVKVDENDKIISLNTCTRFDNGNYRHFIVEAKLVKNKNVGYNYSIKKKKNYEKIEKVLKGDVDNV